MSFSVFDIRLISALLSIFLILPSTCGQGATVTIEELSAYNAQPTDIQECLWEPGHLDVASTVGCTSPVANSCYCPTGIVQQAAILSAITGCMTYWYSATGGLDVAAATSVYSEYCQNAVSATATSTQSTATLTPTSTPTSNATSKITLATNVIIGTVVGGLAALFLAGFFFRYCRNSKFNTWFNQKFGTRTEGTGDA